MKGEIQTETAGRLILFLAVFAIVVSIVILFLSNTGTKQPCKFSARLQLYSSVAGVNSPFDIVCPRKFVRIEDEKGKTSHFDLIARVGKEEDYVYQSTNKDSGGRITQKPTNKVSQDQEQFKTDIAQVFSYELGECWDTFLRGQKDFLNSESFYSDINTCVICSEIYIDRTPFEDFDLNLQSYMNSQPHHFYNLTDSETYGEFLYPYELPSVSQLCKSRLFPEGFIEIRNEESYAVTLIRASGDQYSEIWREVFNVFGAFQETSNYCQTVWVLPLNEVAQHCRALVN